MFLSKQEDISFQGTILSSLSQSCSLSLILLPFCAHTQHFYYQQKNHLPQPSPLASPLLDWQSKHRKREGSIPPQQSGGWAFLHSSCAGVKSLLWFLFHLSSANHCTTLRCLNFDPNKDVSSKDTRFANAPPFTPPPSLVCFYSLKWSVMCVQWRYSSKDPRNPERGNRASVGLRDQGLKTGGKQTDWV